MGPLLRRIRQGNADTSTGGPIVLFSHHFTKRFETKWVLIISEVLLIIATIILPFADSRDKYWSRDFPAFIVGTAGASFLLVNAKYGRSLSPATSHAHAYC